MSPQPPVVSLSERVRIPDKSAVLFFVDGMDHSRLFELLDAGLLPAIKEHFVDGGVGVDYAVSAMPAITYPNSVSLLTGCFPGHHDIMGNLWFDRRTLEIPDYIHADSYRSVNEHFDRRTIYEILDDHFTVSVHFHTRRGVTHTFDNLLPMALDWYTHNFSAVDRRAGETFADIIRLANRRERWPTVTTFYFPGVDEVGHRDGSRSARYTEALQAADYSIGLVCAAIKASPLVEHTYFILVTDHGHVPTPPDRHFNIAGWFERKFDLEVHTDRLKSGSRDARQRQLARSDVIMFTDAGRRAAIHLRGSGGWYSKPAPSLVDAMVSELVDLPAVELVVRRGKSGDVLIRSRRGAAIVQRKVEGSVTFYRLQNEYGDALSYRTWSPLSSFLDGSWHDSRAWLAATTHTAHPDFVPQVVEMFDSPRAGDIVAFAADDWAFDGWNSAHGSCLARDMRVPMFFAGPDLANGAQIENARNVDIMPTVLDLLGLAHRLDKIDPIDGRSVARELRHAQIPNKQQVVTPTYSGELLPHTADQSLDLRRGRVEPLGLDR